MRHAEGVSEFAFGYIFSFDAEFLAVEGADDTVGEVERHFGNGILCKVVIGLVFVEEFGWCDDIVVCVVGAHNLPLALERTGYKGLSGAMVLVGEVDTRDGASGRVGVNEDGVVSLDEAVPLKVEGHALGGTNHVAVHGLGLLGLSVDHLHELAHSVLDSLNHMGFELGKRVLHADEILSVVVLFLELLVEAVHDATLEDVRVVGSRHLASSRVE